MRNKEELKKNFTTAFKEVLRESKHIWGEEKAALFVTDNGGFYWGVFECDIKYLSITGGFGDWKDGVPIKIFFIEKDCTFPMVESYFAELEKIKEYFIQE